MFQCLLNTTVKKIHTRDLCYLVTAIGNAIFKLQLD
jgi:hypothetical protein